MTLVELTGALARRERSAREVVEEHLARIDAATELNAIVAVRAEAALAEADALDRGPVRGPLHGVPVAVKDNLDVAGLPTRAGSRALPDRPATADAEAVRRLRDAGAIVIGKTAMHELAFGITSQNPHTGTVGNPFAPGRCAGGSSGGSAAAIAAGLCAGALGTDTGGSVRIPASLCGGVGLRPTTGLVPRDGAVPLSWTTDTVGPMAATVADVALLFAVLTGLDDRPTADRPRLGVWPAAAIGAEPATAAAFAQTCERLAGAGADLVELPAIDLDAIVELQVVIAACEAVAALAQQLDVPVGSPAFEAATELMGDDVREILRAPLPSAAAYLEAVRVTAPRVRAQLLAALAGLDAIVVPTIPVAPPPADVGPELELAGRPASTFLTLIRCTVPASVAGLPALALPPNLQLVGHPKGDRELLALGAALEAAAR